MLYHNAVFVRAIDVAALAWAKLNNMPQSSRTAMATNNLCAVRTHLMGDTRAKGYSVYTNKRTHTMQTEQIAAFLRPNGRETPRRKKCAKKC